MATLAHLDPKDPRALLVHQVPTASQAHKDVSCVGDAHSNKYRIVLAPGPPGDQGEKGICPKYCALDGGVFFEDGTRR